MNTAAIALCLYVAYMSLAFGLRAWLLYRRTGTTGFNGFSERRGSAGWWGGALFAVAVLTGLLAPILQLLGLTGTLTILDHTPLFLTGLLITVAGTGLTLVAQHAMGRSWRVGVDHSETTELATTGLFSLVRNPVFSSVLLTAVGLALIAPNPVAIAAPIILFIGIELQVRAVEEPYLIAAHGDTYLTYAESTGRLIPGVGHYRRH